ncbi:hypothetical protein PENTCL1PPCAC_5398, partial [Pristionchus entomophagus]
NSVQFSNGLCEFTFSMERRFQSRVNRNNFQVEREYRENFLRRTAEFSNLITKESESRVNSIREASEKARSERENAGKETKDKTA